MNQLPPTNAEIVHVLFIDVVGYSLESMTVQGRWLSELTRTVKSTSAFQTAMQSRGVVPLAAGDGMALIFTSDVTAPARCARELSENLADLRLRMGIHSGLVQRQRDIAGNENMTGEGMNTAQRVMDLADEGYILLTSQYATWLQQFDEWRSFVTPVGEGTTKHGERLVVFNLSGEGFGRPGIPSRVDAGVKPSAAKRVCLLYKRATQLDSELLTDLEAHLAALGYTVFVDRHLKIGVDWAKAIEQQIRSADAVVALISDSSLGSEMLEYELETALDAFRKFGKPDVLPVRIGSDRPLEGAIGAIVNPRQFTVWAGPKDTQRTLSAVVCALTEPPKQTAVALQLEPVGGAVSPDSPFYIVRESDPECLKAIQNRESVILIKGPRQVGKTSLLGRGVKVATESGSRVVITDFQKLSSAQLSSDESFYKLLAATLARQLRINYDFASEWIDVFGSNMNMDNFVRTVLEVAETPFVWFMDEVDRLFGAPFASDFFGLVRSWHNSRATDPAGPWSRFTIVIAYATEAHLFIQDLNQSPFNVGRQFLLHNFNLEQAASLNQLYGSPITSQANVRELHSLIAGQPCLTRRALDALSRGGLTFEALMASAARDDGPFGDHLKRILISVSQMPAVLEAMRASLHNLDISDSEGFHRLLASGTVEQSADGQIVFASNLYRQYMAAHLH